MPFVLNEHNGDDDDGGGGDDDDERSCMNDPERFG